MGKLRHGVVKSLVQDCYYRQRYSLDLNSDYFITLFTYLFLGRGEGTQEERERNVDVGGKQIGCLPHTPRPGTEPATQACAPTRNRTGDLSLCGTLPNPLSQAVQASAHIRNHHTCLSDHRWHSLPWGLPRICFPVLSSGCCPTQPRVPTGVRSPSLQSRNRE